jgi:hypothetical protein
MAYDLSEVARLAGRGNPRVVLRLKDRPRIANARALVLAGLDAAEATRAAVLAEQDDDREWLPSPKQKQHPLPFPVDEALFETWAGVLLDLRALGVGKAGLSLAEAAQLERKSSLDRPPQGFLDLGQLFNAPGDIVIDTSHRRRLREGKAESIEALAGEVFGAAYQPQMPASLLPQRLLRMKGEVDRGEDTFARKLRYLLWLN